MKTLIAVVVLSSFIWWGLIGLSRLASPDSPCHRHGDIMLRWMGFQP